MNLDFQAVADLGSITRCRFDLATPWVHAGYEYASNGWLLVRRPTTLPDTTGRRLPWRPEQYFGSFPDCPETQWPPQEQTVALCPECGKIMDVYPSVAIGSERYIGDAIALLRQVDGMRFAVPSEADNRLCFTDGTLEGVLLPFVKADGER